MRRRARRRRRVDDDAVGNVVARQVPSQQRQVCGDRGLGPRQQGRPVRAGVEARVAERHASARRDAQDPDVDVELLPERGGLLRELRQKGPADQPRPHDGDGQRQRREVEAAVHGAQGAHGVLLVDEDRDVVLGAALRDRPDVDVGLGQGAKHRGGDSLALVHEAAHRGQHGAVADALDRGDAPRSDRVREARPQRAQGPVCLFRLDGKADRVLGGGLGDHHDVALRVADGGEDRGGHAGDADLSGKRGRGKRKERKR